MVRHGCRRVAGVADSKLDAAIDQHRGKSIEPTAAVDEIQVVGMIKCSFVPEDRSEHLSPCELVERGRIGEHAIQIEDDGSDTATVSSCQR